MTAKTRTVFRCLAHTALSTLCLATAMVLPNLASAQFSGGGISPWACPAPSIEQCDTAAYRATACGQARCPALEAFRASVVDRRSSAVIVALPDTTPADRWALGGADPTRLRQTVMDVPEPLTRVTTDYMSFASLRNSLAARSAGSERRDLFPFNFSAWQANGHRVASCIEVAHESFYDISEWDTSIAGYGDDYRRMYEVAFGPTSDTRSVASRHLAYGRFRSREGSTISASFMDLPKSAFHLLAEEGMVAEMEMHLSAEYTPADLAMIARLEQDRPTRRADFTFHQRASAALASMPRITPAQIENASAFSLRGGARRRSATATGYEDSELEYLRQVQRHMLDLMVELAENPVPRCEFRAGDIRPVPPPSEGLVNPPYQAIDTLLGRAGRGARGAAGLDAATSISGFATGVAARDTLAALASIPGGVASFEGAACLREVTRVMATRAALYREILDTLHEGDRWGCFADAEWTPCDWSPGLFVDLTRALLIDGQEETYAECIDLIESARGAAYGFDSSWLFFSSSFQAPLSLAAKGLDGAPCDAPGAIDYTSSAGRFRFAFGLGVRGLSQRRSQCLYRQAQASLRSGYPMLVDPETGEVRPPGFSFQRRGGEGNAWLGLDWSWSTRMDVTGFSAAPQSAAGQREPTCSLEPSASASFSATARVLTQSIPLVSASVSSSYRADSGSLMVMGSAAPSVGEYTIARSSETRTELAQSFPILGISIRLTAGVAGRAGGELTVHSERPSCSGSGTPWSGEARAELIPSVGVDGLASAALDAYVARVGVRGRLELLTTSLPVSVGVRASGASDQVGSMALTYSARAEVTAFSGRLAAFAEIGVCPFCDSAERTIVRWNGLSYAEPLVDETYTLPLDILRIGL